MESNTFEESLLANGALFAFAFIFSGGPPVMVSLYDRLFTSLNWHLTRRGIPDAAAPLIVNLRYHDAFAVEQILNGFDTFTLSRSNVAVVVRGECGEYTQYRMTLPTQIATAVLSSVSFTA